MYQINKYFKKDSSHQIKPAETSWIIKHQFIYTDNDLGEFSFIFCSSLSFQGPLNLSPIPLVKYPLRRCEMKREGQACVHMRKKHSRQKAQQGWAPWDWNIRMKVKVKSLSHIWLFATPWTVPCQAPASIGFSRQEHWSGLPFSSPGDLPFPGMEPSSCALQETLPSEPPGNMEHIYITDSLSQTWPSKMALRFIMLSERSQAQTVTYWMIPFMGNIQNRQIHRNRMEQEMATHSSVLAWRIPWTEEPGGVQSMGSQKLDMTEWLSTHI